VSPVEITKYFAGVVAGKWKRTTVSFHVQSLRSFFRYASSRGWCAAGIDLDTGGKMREKNMWRKNPDVKVLLRSL
jgi:hypothetical protein